MAKESMKAREEKRAKLVARYAEKRAALKKIIATSNDPEEAYEAARKLQSIPLNFNFGEDVSQFSGSQAGPSNPR